MNTLTPKQANDLIRIRGYTYQTDNECIKNDLQTLLDIIDTLQLGSDKSGIPEVHGWTVVLRGHYVHSDSKKPTCLYFVVITESSDDDKILEAIKEQYSGRNNLLDGFKILDYEMHVANERVIMTGTGIGG